MDAYSSFRHANFRYLLTGAFLTNFGLQMLSVAVSWDLYLATHSAIALGNVGLVQVAPFIAFALFAGHFADRHNRRNIMVVTQTLFLAASALLIFYAHSVPIIYTCLFLTATARTFQGPARLAILPHSVPPDSLRNAITWNSSVQEISSVTGPAFAGLILASTGSRSVYILQFGCALLATLCFLLLKVRTEPGPATPAPSGHAILEGVRFVWSEKLILSAMSLDLFSVLFGGATALLPIFALDVLHTGARGLGWLRAATSIGAVSMALIQTHYLRIRHAGRALLWSIAGFGIAMITFGLSRSLPLSFAALVVAGALDNISVVLRQSLVQIATPDHLKGRVLAVNNIFISCSNQLGAVESGWTAALFGPILSVAGGGVATILIVAAFAAKSRPLRAWQH